eukprot:m.516738 g.516738  ORF g.516738 m.516738 type:complete len:63 (+) comp123432_c0_seq1:51-239(+)
MADDAQSKHQRIEKDKEQTTNNIQSAAMSIRHQPSQKRQLQQPTRKDCSAMADDVQPEHQQT